MFKVGDYLVKSNTGVCRICEIVEKDLCGSGLRPYYVLVPHEDERSRFYVPTEADRSRIRRVMTEDEAMDFIRHIKSIEEAWIENDKLREQTYKDALRSNEPAAIVSIIKNIYTRGQQRLAQGKKITATDERYFKQAEDTLYAELAFSLKKNREEILLLIAETIQQ